MSNAKMLTIYLQGTCRVCFCALNRNLLFVLLTRKDDGD